MRAVEHQSVIPDRPAWPASDLLANEAIFSRQQIVGKRILVEQVAELAVERRPLVVTDLQQSVFDTERVAEVLAEVVLGELGRPVGQIAAIEQLQPLPHISRILLRGRMRLIDHHADDEHCERKATHSASCVTVSYTHLTL